MSEVFPEGTVVKVTDQSVSGDPELDPGAAKIDQQYTVCDYAPEGHKNNDDPNKKAYYLLDDEGSYGGSHWAYPQNVEVVQTVKQLAARKLPTKIEVLKALARGVMTYGEGFDIDETGPATEEGVECWGRTDDGLRIYFVVSVSNIEKSDY